MRLDIKNKLNSFAKEELYLLNKSEIARRFNCDPRTVERYINLENGSLPPPIRLPKKSLLDDYKDLILDKVDRHGASAVSIFHFIQQKGYQGKYSILTDFIRQHKQSELRKATVRFETNPGLQAQIDWKENMTLFSRSGKAFQINIFLAVLGYSRLKFIHLTLDRSQPTLFSCLIKTFEYVQGVPLELLFDNMKTVVDRSRSSFSKVELNETFRHFAADAGFRTITCRAYRPQTKGKVESLARLVERLRVYNEEFDSLEELQMIVETFNHQINREISQATGEIPLKRYEKEKEYLNPLPSMDVLSAYIRQPKQYKVTKESMIRYQGHKYSVPTRYIGCQVTTSETDDVRLCIYYNGNLVACHAISERPLNYQPEHLIEILRSDACSHMTEEDTLTFMKNNLSMMDIYLGE